MRARRTLYRGTRNTPHTRARTHARTPMKHSYRSRTERASVVTLATGRMRTLRARHRTRLFPSCMDSGVPLDLGPRIVSTTFSEAVTCRGASERCEYCVGVGRRAAAFSAEMRAYNGRKVIGVSPDISIFRYFDLDISALGWDLAYKPGHP